MTAPSPPLLGSDSRRALVCFQYVRIIDQGSLGRRLTVNEASFSSAEPEKIKKKLVCTKTYVKKLKR